MGVPPAEAALPEPAPELDEAEVGISLAELRRARDHYARQRAAHLADAAKSLGSVEACDFLIAAIERAEGERLALG